MNNNNQSEAVYTDYKHCSVIDAQGGYSDFVQVHIYTAPDGSTEDRVQHYTLKPGERIVDAMPPTSKLRAGAAGFIRPVWDDIASAWVEAATPDEVAAWDADHPAPEPVPEVPSETEQLKAMVAELEAEKAERAELEAMAAAIERGACSMSRWDALEAVVRLAAMQAQANATAMTDDQVLSVSALYPEWAPGNYDVGDVRNREGQTWQCVQAHDSTATPDWSPGSVAALWAPYHATDPRYARPWIQPAGAHDAYQVGECMVLDGVTYRCLQDATVHSPAELPEAWEVTAV